DAVEQAPLAEGQDLFVEQERLLQRQRLERKRLFALPLPALDLLVVRAPRALGARQLSFSESHVGIPYNLGCPSQPLLIRTGPLEASRLMRSSGPVEMLRLETANLQQSLY